MTYFSPTMLQGGIGDNLKHIYLNEEKDNSNELPCGIRNGMIVLLLSAHVFITALLLAVIAMSLVWLCDQYQAVKGFPLLFEIEVNGHSFAVGFGKYTLGLIYSSK